MDFMTSSPNCAAKPASSSDACIRIDTFRQMMYVSGEPGEASVETTSIIEDIVRQQVIELVHNLLAVSWLAR